MPVVVNLRDAANYIHPGMSTRLLESARIGLVKAAARGLQTIVVQIIPSRSPQPVDRGVYKAGWRVEIVDEDTVAILNSEPTAPLIEYGVRGENVKIGMKMLMALSEWAIRKGIVQNSNKHEQQAEAMQVAWAIAKAMQRKGIFNRGGKNGLRIMDELVDRHINKFIEQEIKKELLKTIAR